MRKCLYRRALLVYPFLRLFRRHFFQVDTDTLERVGDAENWYVFRAELSAFASESRMRGGMLKNRLRLRISGNRLAQIAVELFGPEPAQARNAPPRTPVEQEPS